ncbi:Abscisic acid G-protein coupled receptor-domain-containing protein [Terfezia claveryi]|nr:Abscisic acid G-protein coupled receptor-domain-containing protein [Terfezia claveryi]
MVDMTMLGRGAEICTEEAYGGTGCLPPWMHDEPSISSRIGFISSNVIFLLWFIVVATVVRSRRVYAGICNGEGVWGTKSQNDGGGSLYQRLGERAFINTMAATGVLGLLIVCEVSELLNSKARRLWFLGTIWMLIFALVLMVPLLQLHGLLEAVGLTKLGLGRRSFFWIETGLYVGWLWLFWMVGRWVPVMELDEMYWWGFKTRSFGEECRSRIGLLGITLIAILSGCGAISNPWQTYVTKSRPVNEVDIARAQVGLEAANEMLEIKRDNLQALEEKLAEVAEYKEGFISKMYSAVGADPAARELATLQTEVHGLAEMSHTLSAHLRSLRSRYNPPAPPPPTTKSPLRLSLYYIQRFFSCMFLSRPALFLFNIYCIYRIFITVLRHLPYPLSLLIYKDDPSHPSSPTPLPLGSPQGSLSAAESDPVNRILSILARWWTPALNHHAWARQIGFLLTGVIIAGSTSTILRAFNTVTKKLISPSLMTATGQVAGALPPLGQVLALSTAQVTATYVLASALLLRLNLAPEMSSALTEALGAPALDPAFVERWFDAVFMWSVGSVVIGWLVGRGLGLFGREEDVDEFGEGDEGILSEKMV